METASVFNNIGDDGDSDIRRSRQCVKRKKKHGYVIVDLSKWSW